MRVRTITFVPPILRSVDIFLSGELNTREQRDVMESVRQRPYGPPVDQLLTYGEGQSVSPDDWPNYLALGLGPEHIPDLIRMATDEDLNWADSDSLEVWAPLHAWRTLGQFRAEAAVAPLLTLVGTLPDNDWVMENCQRSLA